MGIKIYKGIACRSTFLSPSCYPTTQEYIISPHRNPSYYLSAQSQFFDNIYNVQIGKMACTRLLTVQWISCFFLVSVFQKKQLNKLIPAKNELTRLRYGIKTLSNIIQNKKKRKRENGFYSPESLCLCKKKKKIAWKVPTTSRMWQKSGEYKRMRCKKRFQVVIFPYPYTVCFGFFIFFFCVKLYISTVRQKRPMCVLFFFWNLLVWHLQNEKVYNYLQRCVCVCVSVCGGYIPFFQQEKSQKKKEKKNKPNQKTVD